MAHSKQKQQVASLVEEAERSTKLRGANILAEVACSYLLELDAGLRVQPVDTSSAVIGGLCLGVESLESLTLKTRAIRQDADMIDIEAGICLVLDPDDDTREGLLIGSERLLYLPIGRADGYGPTIQVV